MKTEENNKNFWNDNVDDFFNELSSALPEDPDTQDLDDEDDNDQDDSQNTEPKPPKKKDKKVDPLFEDDDDDSDIDVDFLDDESTENDVEDVDDDKTKKTKPNTKTSPILSALNLFKEKGIMSIDDNDMPQTEEDAIDSIEEIIHNAVENRVQEVVAGTPDIVQNLIKYVVNGGDPHVFLNTVMNEKPRVLSANLDLNDETNQELVIQTQLLADGYDQEYIDSQIEFFKDSGKLRAVALSHFKRWEKQEAQRQEQMAQRQREQALAEREDRRKRKVEFAELINLNPVIDGVKLSHQDKMSLPTYLTERNIQQENGAVVTPFIRDINKLLLDPKKAVLLAKLVKSNLDMSAIVKQLKSDITADMRNNVRRVTPQDSTKKTLADYL